MKGLYHEEEEGEVKQKDKGERRTGH